jgi:hypothetical protein
MSREATSVLTITPGNEFRGNSTGARLECSNPLPGVINSAETTAPPPGKRETYHLG